MKTYNKLVRDNIPWILNAKGIFCTFDILTPEQYVKYLKAKLVEELEEYSRAINTDNAIMELVDMTEVISALLTTYDVSPDAFQRLCLIKRAESGGFYKRVRLINTEEE